MLSPFKVDLVGKTAVVTGGTGILCGVMVEALAECGARVVVLGREFSKANEKAEELRRKGYEAIGVEANVVDLESLRLAEKEIFQKFGPCDILINGAGGNHPDGTTSNEFLSEDDLKKIGTEGFKSFFDLKPEGVRFVFDLNFLGTFLPTQVFAKRMVERKRGVIVNISSMNAFCPLTKIPAYSGAKAAVSNFTQWLAVHFSRVGIRVNAIAPGFFITKQNESLLKNPDGTFTARAQKIINHTPMGRFGNADELLGALLWLVDDRSSSFVTGIVVPVDGGFSAYSGV